MHAAGHGLVDIRRGRHTAQRDEARRDHQRDECQIHGAPAQALLGQAPARLEQERVREEPDQAARVRRRVQEVRVVRASVAAPREPPLEERTGSRDREEGQADPKDERTEEPEHRLLS